MMFCWNTAVHMHIWYTDSIEHARRPVRMVFSKDLLLHYHQLIFVRREVYHDRGPSNHGRGTHDDSGPAMEAWETLKQESPSYFLSLSPGS